MNKLFGKKILLGVTGGIAIYKVVELTRLLVKSGAKVKVIMTKSALEFIQPLTFITVSQQPVYTEMFRQDITTNIEHIELAKWADLVLIAPATANMIAKLAHGIADDLLSTVCLAATAPMCVVPAMNKEMWAKNITQANVKQLINGGIKLFGPASGVQACGDDGAGRMLEPNEILDLVNHVFVTPLLKGKKIIITAGPTVEAIDPVRFISNRSSGKMGYAIAQAAVDHGAEVTLISGPTNLTPPKVNLITVTTANEMYDAVMQNIECVDIFIAAAAVADYRPENNHPSKLKRNEASLTLKLVPNPDILASVTALSNPPITVGFAAETDNLINNAQHKLITKKVDILAANLVGENIGFDRDYNSLELFTKNGAHIKLSEKNKLSLAYELIEFIASI